MDEDRLNDLEARALMLERVTALAWSNLISASGGSVEDAQRIADDGAVMLAKVRDMPDSSAQKRWLCDAISRHETDFWKQVQEEIAGKRRHRSD